MGEMGIEVVENVQSLSLRNTKCHAATPYKGQPEELGTTHPDTVLLTPAGVAKWEKPE